MKTPKPSYWRHLCSAILVHPKWGLRRFISSTSSITSREGPFGPGFLRFGEEYNKRYFRFTRAWWNFKRVDGRIRKATRLMRQRSRNVDHRPGKKRSKDERLGARFRDWVRTSSCAWRIINWRCQMANERVLTKVSLWAKISSGSPVIKFQGLQFPVNSLFLNSRWKIERPKHLIFIEGYAILAKI